MTQGGTATVIQVYAPNTADNENEVDNFYNQLQTAINDTPNYKDLIIIMGDFNVKIGQELVKRHGPLWLWNIKCQRRKTSQLLCSE